MTETHATEAHHGPNVMAYYVVFGALAVFTAISFIVNHIFGSGNTTGMLIILGVAVVKACLVGAIFMHLRWDWSRLYFMIVPAFILAPMLVIVLLPDIVIAWRHQENQQAKEKPAAVSKKTAEQ